MNKFKNISIFYYFSALYDGILGIVFLFFPLTIYNWFEVTHPNHVGYVQFPAALLIIFAIMFLNIGRHPLQNRNLIPYGILLKISYCAVVFGYWGIVGLPDMWKYFAVFDAIFAGFFIWTYLILGRE